MSKIPKYFKVEVGRRDAGIKVTPIFDDDNIVEVVRCKDCKYFTPQPDTIEACCDLTYSRALPDDYCSYGERRESE